MIFHPSPALLFSFGGDKMKLWESNCVSALAAKLKKEGNFAVKELSSVLRPNLGLSFQHAQNS